MTLAHLARALQEEALKLFRQETGQDPDSSPLSPDREGPQFYPFAVSFQIKTFDHRGPTTYTVTISEASNL